MSTTVQQHDDDDEHEMHEIARIEGVGLTYAIDTDGELYLVSINPNGPGSCTSKVAAECWSFREAMNWIVTNVESDLAL
jgi:hypothetical protein